MKSETPEVEITGRHIELTDPIREYVQKKLDSIDLNFPKVIHVHVILEVQKHRQRCELIFVCNGHGHFETSHESDDLYASIDLCADKLERRMRKYKTRVLDHRHQFPRQAFRPNKHGFPTPIGGYVS